MKKISGLIIAIDPEPFRDISENFFVLKPKVMYSGYFGSSKSTISQEEDDESYFDTFKTENTIKIKDKSKKDSLFARQALLPTNPSVSSVDSLFSYLSSEKNDPADYQIKSNSTIRVESNLQMLTSFSTKDNPWKASSIGMTICC